MCKSVDARNELVLDDGAVAVPVLAVLGRAALKVAAAAVDEDDDEEEEEGSSDYASGSEQSDQGREAIDRFKDDLFADDDEGDKSKDGMYYSRFGC